MSSYSKLSQLAPLPRLKDVEIGKTIGHGGFGVVKSARIRKSNMTKDIAVKFVHIEMAKQQQVTTEMLIKEAFIQKECWNRNVIQLIDVGVDQNWVWMAMELGTNGELFDKIEPDLGVDEDVAQFYFNQLINAVSFIHSRGVAHRDIKPENLVLDKYSNLKLTDFGLATVFKKKNGPKRLCTTACGSPPYLAPEVITQNYDPERADIWSCGIVLFVLLTGKVAWEMPHIEDPDFSYFVEHKGHILVSPWNRIPVGALSSLRKILNPDPSERATIDGIRSQPWVSKKNNFTDKDGLCKDPLKLTARLLVNLYISLSDEEFNKVNQAEIRTQLSEEPVKYLMDDTYESNIYKENYQPIKTYSSSQIVYTEHSKRKKLRQEPKDSDVIISMVSKDPAALQFINGSKSQSREKQITEKMAELQEHQRRYPELFAENFTKFFSVAPLDQLLVTLLEALRKLGFRTDAQIDNTEDMIESLTSDEMSNPLITLPISGKDRSNGAIVGNIKVRKMADNLGLRRIEFTKAFADPLEWRRVFRNVTILCRDVVYVEGS